MISTQDFGHWFQSGLILLAVFFFHLIPNQVLSPGQLFPACQSIFISMFAEHLAKCQFKN